MFLSIDITGKGMLVNTSLLLQKLLLKLIFSWSTGIMKQHLAKTDSNRIKSPEFCHQFLWHILGNILKSNLFLEPPYVLNNPSAPFKVHGHLQPRSPKHFYYKLIGTNMSRCQIPKLYFKESFAEKAVTQLLKSNGIFSKSFMSDWDDCESVFYL